jgi:hypothetical protein
MILHPKPTHDPETTTTKSPRTSKQVLNTIIIRRERRCSLQEHGYGDFPNKQEHSLKTDTSMHTSHFFHYYVGLWMWNTNEGLLHPRSAYYGF